MVNDGNLDRGIRSGWEWSRTSTAVMEENLVAFADWCDTTDTCALYGRDTKKVYAELKRRARAGTLTDPSTGQPLNLYNLTLVAEPAAQAEDQGRATTGDHRQQPRPGHPARVQPRRPAMKVSQVN